MTFSDVKVAVTAPSGWQVAATTAASQASLAPGASFTTKWQITAPRR